MARIVDEAERESGVLRQVVDFNDKHVLDIGCGEGRTAWRIARTAASVVGVDPDPERIATAQAMPRHGATREPRFLAEDIVSLDLDTGAFDMAIFTRSL